MQQQAKAVVLGDVGVGKTSLVNALASLASRRESHGSPFVSVDIPRAMLDEVASSVTSPTAANQAQVPGSTQQQSSQGGDLCLKFWEHRGNADRREYETVFPGALFCIVVCDIRSPESANSAFNKWMAVRDSYMTESFLFVVGNFLDDVVHRRVEINEICKACAQRDAIYLEVSSTTGKNVPFLWHLIIQRINYMMNVKSHMQLQIREGGSKAGEDAFPAATGAGRSKGTGSASSSEDAKTLTPFLEGDVDVDSIGSVLASTVGLEFWPGYEAEQENLAVIDGLSQASIHDVVLQKCGDYRLAGNTSATTDEGGRLYDEPDLEELRHSYELMGLTLPAAILEPMQTAPIKSVTSSVLDSVTVKLRVRLPDGAEAIMQLRHGVEEVKTQVARFLAQNGMQSDSLAYEKLVKLGSSLLADQIRVRESQAAETAAAPKPSSNPVPKCVVRVKLPSGQTIETVVSRDEDAQVVAARIAAEHGLSMGYQNKVWEQLRSAQKLSFKSVEAPTPTKNAPKSSLNARR